MKRPTVIAGLLLIPALLILSGFYFQQEILSSIGYVVVIFYIIMLVRGRVSTGTKKTED